MFAVRKAKRKRRSSLAEWRKPSLGRCRRHSGDSRYRIEIESLRCWAFGLPDFCEPTPPSASEPHPFPRKATGIYSLVKLRKVADEVKIVGADDVGLVIEGGRIGRDVDLGSSFEQKGLVHRALLTRGRSGISSLLLQQSGGKALFVVETHLAEKIQ